jgi:hypothetical protein
MAARASNRKNPSELLIFGNPGRKRGKKKNAAGETSRSQQMKSARDRAGRIKAARLRNTGNKNHKPNCACPICKRARGENPPKHKARKLTPAQKRNARKLDRQARRNPSDGEQAVKLFESFHGRDAQEVIEAQRSAAMRLDYTALGPLVALGFDDCGFSESKLPTKWDQCPHIDFQGDKVKLASAPNGKQLYFIGGTQNLDSSLSMFEGIDTQKDLIDLGEVVFVVYEARKVHDNFEPVEYCHRFGAKGKTLPRLAYDKLKKEMLLIGGEYFIDTKAGVSPGIEG